MKKVLLILCLAASVVAFGQNDLSITLTSPVANATIGPGIPFSIDLTITNNGTQDVTMSDTVIYVPTVNGGTLTLNGQIVGGAITGTMIAGGGGSVTRSLPFGGLNITGAPAGPLNFCAVVIGRGPNWTGVTESDTTNNVSCNTVNYDPNSIGLDENVVTVALEQKAIDNSYFANGVYHVDVDNVSNDNHQLVVFDITGREVFSTSLNTVSGRIQQDVELGNFKSGIYVTVIKSELQTVATKKIMLD